MGIQKNTKFKKHFNAEDIFFLKVSQDYSTDIVKIVDKLISCKFKKMQRGQYSMQSSTFMYFYEEPIKTHCWQKREKAPYLLKIFVMKTHKDLFVPVVIVKDRATNKEIDRVTIPDRHLKCIDRVVDKNLNRLINEGLLVISDNKIIQFKDKGD